MTLINVIDQDQNNVDQAAQNSNAALSPARSFGLSLLLASFVMLEILLPRISGDRPNLPLFVLISFGILIANRKYFISNLKSVFIPPIFFILLYSVWLVLSTTWSYNPKESFLQSICYFMGVIAIFCFADVRPETTAKKLITIITSVSIASWLFLLIAPSLAALAEDFHRLNGIMIHCQRLALLSGTGLLLWSSLKYRNNVATNKIQPLLFLVTLLATKTRFFITIFIASVMALFYSRASTASKFFLALTAIAAASLLVLEINFVTELYSREESNDATLSGRTTIWEKSIEMIIKKPWLGYGFSTFYSDLTSWFFVDYVAPHAHNAWINAAFESGLIGASLMTMGILSAIYAYIRLYISQKMVPIGAMIWAVVIIAGFMGVVFGGKMNPFVGITLILLVQELTQHRDASENKKQVYSNIIK